MKKKNSTTINISLLRNNKYYHLLRFAFVGDDSYVHFISSYRKEVKYSDGDNVFYEKLPDHISYHKDGKVHIKHKGGTYSNLPFKLPEKFLTQTKLFDFNWIAISFYDGAFDEHLEYFKCTDDKPDNHIIIESHLVSFTILVKVKDMTTTPLENRTIDFEVRIGGLVPDQPYPNLLENESKSDKKFPVLNICLNPTLDLINDFKLFSKNEVDNCEKFYNYLTKTFANTV